MFTNVFLLEPAWHNNVMSLDFCTEAKAWVPPYPENQPKKPSYSPNASTLRTATLFRSWTCLFDIGRQNNNLWSEIYFVTTKKLTNKQKLGKEQRVRKNQNSSHEEVAIICNFRTSENETHVTLTFTKIITLTHFTHFVPCSKHWHKLIDTVRLGASEGTCKRSELDFPAIASWLVGLGLVQWFFVRVDS